MSRRGSTGEIRVWFVPTIASVTLAPSVAEITAGTDITPYLTRDGVATPNSASTIDVSDLADRRNKRAPGSFGGDDWTATLYRDSVTGADTAWTLLVQDLEGYFVIRRFGGSAAAIAAGQKVEVASIAVNSRQMNSPADNASQMFVANLVTSRVNDSATVAA